MHALSVAGLAVVATTVAALAAVLSPNEIQATFFNGEPFTASTGTIKLLEPHCDSPQLTDFLPFARCLHPGAHFARSLGAKPGCTLPGSRPPPFDAPTVPPVPLRRSNRSTRSTRSRRPAATFLAT